ncbi:MAG TPA: preprotein translocase subunit YajC [Acidimicrobiia bacterium]|nr:preprotein translocase subunit YajC [Acidimicrobiia bacterium]
MSPLLLTTTPPASSGYSSLIFLGVMVAVFYVLILRPQRKRMRAQQELTAALSLGDKVQTIGGIQGVIRALDDDAVVIEVEQGRMRVVRRAIASRIVDKA